MNKVNIITKFYMIPLKTLPSSVQINGNTVTMPQLLYLLTTATLEVNSGITTPITIKNVNPAPAPSGYFRSGNIYKASFITYAQNIINFINTNGKAPNFAYTSLGNIPFKYLVYMYSKIINYYANYNLLPNYVYISP